MRLTTPTELPSVSLTVEETLPLDLASGMSTMKDLGVSLIATKEERAVGMQLVSILSIPTRLLVARTSYLRWRWDFVRPTRLETSMLDLETTTVS